LAFQPLLTFMVLTVRTVPMAAGVRHQYLMVTFGAPDLYLEAGLGAALFHGRECSVVVSRESAPVLRQEVCLEGCDD
jgi:hypothetical protein